MLNQTSIAKQLRAEALRHFFGSFILMMIMMVMTMTMTSAHNKKATERCTRSYRKNKQQLKYRKVMLNNCRMVGPIHQRSDYTIGFIAPAIGTNKSRKLTQLISSAHNTQGEVWMKKKQQQTWLHRGLMSVCEAMYVVFHSNLATSILCRLSISRVSFLDLLRPIAGAISPIM